MSEVNYDKQYGVLRKLAKEAQVAAPDTWERDSERMDDSHYRHYEFYVTDGKNRRMFGTENADASFGEIAEEWDCDSSYAWNEPSRIVIDYVVAVQPKVVIELLDKLAAQATEIAELKARL